MSDNQEMTKLGELSEELKALAKKYNVAFFFPKANLDRYPELDGSAFQDNVRVRHRVDIVFNINIRKNRYLPPHGPL